MNIDLKSMELGPVQANCYILTDTDSGDIAVIDPGDYTPELETLLQGRLDKVKLILLTHRHYDHVLGVAKLKERTGAKTAIHKEDAAALSDGSISRAGLHSIPQIPIEVDIILENGDKIPFGNNFFEVIHTPGHSAGSVCYLLGDMLFSGDTLFAGTVGRTDLPTGSGKDMMRSLGLLSAMDFSGTVYPGHGPFTTMERERSVNPYFR